jgi:hypothetical protein
MQKLVGNSWTECSQGDLIDGDTYRVRVGNGGWQQQKFIESPPPPPPIRIITVSAMQGRFDIDEEVAILDGNDTKSKAFMSRMLNAKNIDLDSQKLSKGLDHVLNFLNNQGAIYENATPVERKIKLLEDGKEEERWP